MYKKGSDLLKVGDGKQFYNPEIFIMDSIQWILWSEPLFELPGSDWNAKPLYGAEVPDL